MTARSLALTLALAFAPTAARAGEPPRAPDDEPEVEPHAPSPSGVPSPGLVHEAVTSSHRGLAIEITVGVQNELAFDHLVLAYRRAGAAEFRRRTFERVSGGTFRAEIPSEATRGTTVAYFIEALDADGGPVAGRGSASSPLVVALVGPLAAVSARDEDEDDGAEGPLVRERFFVGLFVGSGAGWASGNGDTNADVMLRPSALALAGLGHLAPEVGVWWRPWLLFSLQGRFQMVTGATDLYAADGAVYHAASYAAAVFAKATWLADGPGRVHPFFSLSAGGGTIRHVVTFNALNDCGPSRRQTCVDTITAGPVAAGPGGGLMAELGGPFQGVLQVNTQVTFPAFTFNVDMNLGVAAKF